MCFVSTLACIAFAAAPLSGQESVPAPKPKFSEDLLRLQIFLDRQLFGPGKLDGLPGEFTTKALERFQWAQGMSPKPLDAHGIDLSKAVPDLYTTYTIREEDRNYIGSVPSKPAQQSLQKYLPYASLLEFLAERFHSSEGMLRLINAPTPGEEGGERPVPDLDSLKPGDVLKVPNVEPFRIEDLTPLPSLPEVPEFRTRMIFIDTRERMLELHGSECGPLLASFPITPGSGRLATPPGHWKIVGIAQMPTFRWDESVLEYGVRSDEFYQLPIGPNNPVGILWAGLSKPGIGIHGTNQPETIGRASSHGCMRTANWDAIRLSKMITKGIPVIIEGPRPSPNAKPKPAQPAPPARKPWFWWLQPS